MKNHTLKLTKRTRKFFAQKTGVKNPAKNRTPARAGFTLVELSIAMAAIASLLITVAIVTTNLVTIYQKGLTVKAVNNVGRNLIDEFISAINTAPSVDTTSLCTSLASGSQEALAECKADHAFNYIFHASQNTEGEQYNGIFCTGYYSYIWNTYYSETTEGHSLRLKYLNMNGDTVETNAPRLMKVEDRTYRVCSAVMNDKYESEFKTDMVIDITTLAHSGANGNALPNRIPDPEEGMLDEFDLDMTLYELTIFPISQDSVTLRTYMSGTFILATLRGNVDIMRSGDYCETGTQIDDGNGHTTGDTGNLNNLGSEFNYCAINKFNFAARTAGV